MPDGGADCDHLSKAMAEEIRLAHP
jgi:hypothetical protein